MIRTPVATSIRLCGSRRSSAITSAKTASTPTNPSGDALEHRPRSCLEGQRLEEQHRLEPLPVDAREPERDQPDRLGGQDAERRAGEDPLLPPVEVLKVLLPVDPVVEPVEDQEQHGDRHERDDRLEPLTPACQRAEHGLRHDPGHGAGRERESDPGEERLSNPRCAPTMLAISAARMSTASSPSRKTMIALFVTTETRELGPLPMPPRPRLSASVERRAASPRAPSARGVPLRSCASPSTSPSPYQKSPSILWNRRRRETPEPLLRAELEDAVGLEAA